MTTAIITFAGFTGLLGKGVARRELQCLLAIAAGRSSKEAARDLGIAAGSIDKRLLALTTKLGVTRRAALVAKAFALGLITFAGAASPSPENHHPENEHDGVFLA